VIERFGREDFAYRWSGQIIEPADGLPYIGSNSASDNVFVATGFSGNGMTFGTVAGMMLSDAAQGRSRSLWTELYEATRMKVLGAVKDMLVENVDYPVHLIGDRLAVPDRTADDLSPGEGRRGAGGRAQARGVLRRARHPPRAEPGVHPHGLPRGLEHRREELGLPLPRRPLRRAGGQVLNGPPVQPLEARPMTEPTGALVVDENAQPTGALT
jgi:hypothetical protein